MEAVETTLRNMRILITRPENKGDELAKAIEHLGATPLELPTVEIKPPRQYSDLDRCILKLREYDWAIFTSATGVKSFMERAALLGTHVQSAECSFAAVGPATASELERNNVKVSFLPKTYLTEKLAHFVPNVTGRRVLLVRAEDVDQTMKRILTSRGAQVDQVAAYSVQSGRPPNGGIDFDAVIFTSPSTVKGYMKMNNDLPRRVAKRPLIWCIGPVTARAARQHGLRVDMVAKEHTIGGIIKEIMNRYATTDRSDT
jgi:uroporphyrinogen-III synthase